MVEKLGMISAVRVGCRVKVKARRMSLKQAVRLMIWSVVKRSETRAAGEVHRFVPRARTRAHMRTADIMRDQDV